jgi:hypothetical protein
VKKGVGDEQITEFVVLHGLRNAQHRKDRDAGAKRQKADHYHRESPPSSEESQIPLCAAKPVRANPWIIASENHGDDGQKSLNE